VAILAAVRSQRRAGIGQNIADVSLIDGSKDARSNAAELGNATVPITLFYRSNEEFAVFKEHIGCTPLLFMCLAGNLDMKDSHERGQFVATSHFAHQKALVAFIIGPWDIWAIRPN